MSRWFRHYAGMMRDDKMVRAALAAKQPIERVLWVWGAILESAAEIDDGGRYEIDPAEIAYFLRADAADIVAITDALGGIGRLDKGFVAKWGTRQFQSDRSAERQKRHRERSKEPCDGDRKGSDGEVTAVSRHADAPETETEANTEKKEDCPKRVRTVAPEKFEDFWKRYPKTPVMSKKQALAEWLKLSEEDQSAALDAVEPFKSWLSKQKDHPVVHACRFLSQRRFEGFKPESSGPMNPPGFAIKIYKERGTWNDVFGPEPGKPGCRASPEDLAKYGYQSEAAA